jgi:DNA-directed RNA polymerase specialized sigma24 family protein
MGVGEPDNRSFDAGIAARYGNRLRRFLSVRLRNTADVPDLAQEVFLRLLRVASVSMTH